MIVPFIISLDAIFDVDEVLKTRKKGNLKNLPKPAAASIVEEQRGVVTTSVELKGGYGILNLFNERGPNSNHVYAPTVNHRQVEFKSMMKVTTDAYGKTKKPLISSMLNRTNENDFSTKERPCVLFYQSVNDQEKFDNVTDKGLRVKTTGLVQVIGDGSPTSNLVQLNLAFCIAEDVSKEEFRKLLKIFNHKSSVGGPPDQTRWAQFVSLFRESNLGTPETFKEFISDFKLEDVYTYDDAISIEKNHHRLGESLRAITSVRVASFEGQHRMVLSALASSGFYKAEGIAPLTEMTFQDAVTGD